MNCIRLYITKSIVMLSQTVTMEMKISEVHGRSPTLGIELLSYGHR